MSFYQKLTNVAKLVKLPSIRVWAFPVTLSDTRGLKPESTLRYQLKTPR
jgi:hypothetical protein